MHNFETIFEVNKLARRNRHLKNFSRASLMKIHSGYFVSSLLIPARNWITKTPIFKGFGRFFVSVSQGITKSLPISPKSRLLFQACTLSIAVLFVTSLTAQSNFTSASLSYGTDYISSVVVPGDILIADESGYLLKINPQTDESNRIGLTDFAVHAVESGETLSVIAARYGVKVETIMWENGISNANSLRVGQTILVPPVDGIGYNASSGDTLEKIATKYNISTESIIAQNSLESETLTKGQSIFLPGAKPLAPPVIASRDGELSRGNTRSYEGVTGSSATPAIGKMFIFPTRGSVTQGYHAGHYAFDIADRSKPPIWAGAGGTVTKASSGTWGGGYGNHVIIDHGNGVQTLYAHMDSLNVTVGQWVNQGDVIGIMGNTGRVYGVTGIHLHWEVIINGVKVYPGDYY